MLHLITSKSQPFPNDTSQVLKICDYNLSIMAPWHSSDMRATITSDPNIHANYVGNMVLFNLAIMKKKKKKKLQQSIEAARGLIEGT